MDDERYKEEQEGEIEALTSIYADEITVISEDPYSFTIPLKALFEDSNDNDSSFSVEACLQFTFTNIYPDEIPLIQLASSCNIEEEDEKDLIASIKEEAEQNLGMAMIFTLVSVAQENLENIIEKMKKEREEAKRAKELEIQKEEEQKYHGTPVTVESFTKWRIKFENALNLRLGKKIKDESETKKLTGRQLFERDSSLQFSDAKFYSEGTGAVQVDESLFQDLDDLDMDGIDLDDDDDIDT